MKRLLLAVLPARAAAQIAVIVVGSLLLANLVTAVVLLMLLPRELRKVPNFPHVIELIMVARQVHAAPSPEARATITNAALAAQPLLTRIDAGVSPSQRPIPWPDSSLLSSLQNEVGGIAQAFLLDAPAGQRGPPTVAVRFPDGSGLAMAPPPMTPPPRGFAFIVYLIVTLASLASLIGLLSLWATRAVVSPLSRLAEAADQFDPDRGSDIAIARGPVEVKRLAAAFGAMALRIRRLVDDRTRMLAAVSHDLRTPITRLRLRAEEIGESEVRQPVLADLALMERMVSGALSYLREGRASGSISPTDVAALLQTIADDFADLGQDVVYRGAAHASALCDADQMTRAVTNLVDNAVKFGGKAILWLDESDPQRCVIVVEDHGPGIAAAERDRVLEPFYRSDAARTIREGSGFGLGLSIVQAIAQAHRGTLELAERSGGGLEARISWPRTW